MSSDNDVTIVLALNRIAALIGIFLEMPDATNDAILWVLVFFCAKFHNNLYEEF